MAPFPNLPLDKQGEGDKDEAQSQSQAESSNQNTQGQQPLSEEQIQECLRRANQVYADPRTNTARRNTNVPAGRNRNRSATVSYSRPPLPNLPQPSQTQAPTPSQTQLGTPVPRIVVTDTDAPPGGTAEQDLLPSTERTFVRGRGRGRGLSVPGRTSYIPTLPDLDRPTSSGRGRGRPVPVGAFDNPLAESQERRADRLARTEAVNQFRETQRRQDQQRRLQDDQQRSQEYRYRQQQRVEGQTPPSSQYRPLPPIPAGRYPTGTPTVLRRPLPLAGQENTQPSRPSPLLSAAHPAAHGYPNPLHTDQAPSTPRSVPEDQQSTAPAAPHDRSQQDSPAGDSDGSEEPEFQLATAQIGYTVVARTPRTLPPVAVTRSTLAQSFSFHTLQSRLVSQSSSTLAPRRQQPSTQVSSSTESTSKDRYSKDQKKNAKGSAKAFRRTELTTVCEDDSENGSGSEDEESDDDTVGPSKSRHPRNWERRDDQGPPPDGSTRGTSGTGKSDSRSVDRGSSNEKRKSSGGVRHIRSIFGLKKKKNQAFVLVLIIATKDIILVPLV